MKETKFQKLIRGLDRPLVIFDAETTGLDTKKDKIIQLAYKKVYSTGEVEHNQILINPNTPIPEEYSSVHGITDELVKDKPIFKRYAKSVYDKLKGCYVSGFNSNQFDVPILITELERSGIIVRFGDFELFDIRLFYINTFPNTLSGIYERLFGESFDNAHEAMSDVNATYEILEYLANYSTNNEVVIKNIVKNYDGDLQKLDYFGNFVKDNEGEVIINFGKNKGKPATSDLSYLNWMLNNDFSEQTKNIIKQLTTKTKTWKFEEKFTKSEQHNKLQNHLKSAKLLSLMPKTLSLWNTSNLRPIRIG